MIMSDKIIPNKLFFEQVEEMLLQGKQVRIKVHGVSMMPTIRNGRDSVTIEPIAKRGKISLYDIVLFCYNGTHILHRVVAIDGDRVTTRGDGSYYAEEQCNDRDIVGVVTLIHKANGKVVNPYSSFCKLYAKLWSSLPAPLRRLSLRILKKIL